MPVARSSVESASAQDELVQFSDHAHQAAEPPEHVQSMSYGQHIEKRVADVGGEAKSLGLELHPGKGLPGNKKQSQEQRYVQPPRRVGCLIPGPAHEVGNPAARNFQCEAAGNDQKSVQVKHRWQSDV